MGEASLTQKAALPVRVSINEPNLVRKRISYGQSVRRVQITDKNLALVFIEEVIVIDKCLLVYIVLNARNLIVNVILQRLWQILRHLPRFRFAGILYKLSKGEKALNIYYKVSAVEKIKILFRLGKLSFLLALSIR